MIMIFVIIHFRVLMEWCLLGYLSYILSIYFVAIILSSICLAGYISYNFVIGAYSYWGPKAGYNIYHMV